ncbi:hypothetical protein [Micromonospora zhanjiangensis]|uniref:Uncharacterized protein n=1 Tax=Micromonospora zhanjiangensis TaxID=1522057 RepID=A0ABV8KXW7_9ACTN
MTAWSRCRRRLLARIWHGGVMGAAVRRSTACRPGLRTGGGMPSRRLIRGLVLVIRWQAAQRRGSDRPDLDDN